MPKWGSWRAALKDSNAAKSDGGHEVTVAVEVSRRAVRKKRVLISLSLSLKLDTPHAVVFKECKKLKISVCVKRSACWGLYNKK